MNSIISYTKEVPVFKYALGAIVLLFGLFLLLSGGLFIGLLFSVIGINLFSFEGAEIDLSNKAFRNIKSIFGLKFEKWKPFPEFEYVTVFKTNESQRINVVSATTAIQYGIIHLNLFYNRNKHITVYKTHEIEDAFKVAKHIASAIDIDILDATSSEKVWLEK